MSFYLGGQTVVGIGWAGPHAVYLDYVSQYTDGYLWQLYANRRMIGTADLPRQRRIIGQIIPADAPYPLTLVRVDAVDSLTDFGPLLPLEPWNRYRLNWTAPGLSADTDHFDVIGATAPGVSPDQSIVVAKVPYYGDIAYAYDLPPISEPGAWQFGIVPRDNALPLGNPGTEMDVTLNVVVMPADVRQDSAGNRFDLSVAAGVVTADFAYG